MAITLKQLAHEALDVQDACNALGVSKGYARALQQLRECLTALGQPDDTMAVREHAINRMWASKIQDLAGMGFSDTVRFSQAYDECRLMAYQPD